MKTFPHWHYAAKLRKLFSPQDKRKFIGIILLMALSGFLEMAGIGLLAGAAAIFLSPEAPAAQNILTAFQRFAPGASRNTFFFSAIALIVLLLILKNGFSLLIVSIQSRFVQKIQNELSCRMFHAYLKSDFRYLSSRSVGDCSGNIERIPLMCQNYLQTGMQMWADWIVVFFLAAAALILLPLVTVGGVFFLLCCGGAIHWATKKINENSGRRLQQAEEAESRIRFAGLLGAQEIKVSGCEDLFLRRFREPHSAVSRCFSRLYTLGQLPRLGMECAALLLASGLFCILLLAGQAKEEILLTFTILVAGMARILPALSRCHYNLTLIRQYQAMFDAITGELDAIPPETMKTGGPVPDAGKEIRFEAVSFAYSPEKPLFSALSFSMLPGQITGIAGKSGIGKSTAACLLAGLLRPDSGAITAGGVPIGENLPAWRRQLGFVPQNVFLFDGTIRENVAFGEEKERIDDRKVRHALELAQLPEFFGHENDLLHAGGASLSGGQRQRLGIARALYRDAKLLILDEATSALDPATENAVCQVLSSLRGQITILLISHRPKPLSICDHTVTVQNGGAADGTLQ